MSDVMLFGVLRMPYELAMGDELSQRQFYDRAQQAAQEIEALKALANDARDAWDNDQDGRVGKLLLAMIDERFRFTYRPDLVTPNVVYPTSVKMPDSADR